MTFERAEQIGVIPSLSSPNLENLNERRHIRDASRAV